MGIRRCRRLKPFALLLLILAGILFFWGLALAAGDPAHGGDRSDDLRDLVYRIINFSLLVIILFVVLRKVGIKHFFESRGEEIQKKLEDLKKTKEDSERKYRELEKRLKEFDQYKTDLLEQYRAEGLAEKERIVAEARLRVNQIIEDAEAAVRQEMQEARERLKLEVAGLAAGKAEEIISKEMTEKDQNKLVHDFIERVGKGH